MFRPASKFKGGSRYPRKANPKSCSQTTETDAMPRNGTAESLSFSKRLAYKILSVALQRVGDLNLLIHVHIWLVFLACVVKSEASISLVGQSGQDRFGCKEFLVPGKGRGRPLPEDHILRGLECARRYSPSRWFEDARVDEEERSVEVPSMGNVRIEHILWLATQVASNNKCLVYADQIFRVHPALVTRIEEHQKLEATITHEQKLRRSRMTPTSEDSDIDITSGEDERLKQQQRQLKSQLKASGKTANPAEEPKQAVAKGPESLNESYSALVVYTNLLLSQPEVFKLMVPTSNWPIVIPNTVITELPGSTNRTDPVGDEAKVAMIAINEALTDKRDVKVVTAKGSNVGNIVTLASGETRRQAIPGDYGGYEAAVLITEDRGSARPKRKLLGSPAVAPDWHEDEVVLMEPSGEFDSVLNVRPISTVRKEGHIMRAEALGVGVPKVTWGSFQ
ncbi:hypothetical protein HOY80DRAFT_1102347 [Tuber brumale]|nr:hypothetical protein HOY80DRAFT_1102347 [Tuber brumale]